MRGSVVFPFDLCIGESVHLNRKLTFQGVGGVVLCLCIEGVANVRSTG